MRRRAAPGGKSMTKQIAIFDYRITSTNPIGSCHLNLLRNLCTRYDFTVFSVEFENPCPERIQWVRIPAPVRPYALLFAFYHFLAPIYYRRLLAGKKRFDLIQFVEANLSFGDIAYVHFCHRYYLAHHWKQSRPSGIRRLVKWLEHWVTSAAEPLAFRKMRTCIVPSQGLARELVLEYPW
jgi:hypothetical protein